MAKFWGLLDLSSHLENRRKENDRRRYDRYTLPKELDAHATIEGPNTRLEIADLSYDGLRAQSNHSQSIDKIEEGKVYFIRLSYLGHHLRVKAKAVKQANNWQSFQFFHETPDSLLELRSLLEPLRKGRSIISTNPKGPIWQNNRAMFRGDGPSEITLIKTNNEGILFSSITMNESDFITEVTMENNKISINKGTVKLGRVSSKTLDSQFSSTEVLRSAIIILTQLNYNEVVGFKDKLQEKLIDELNGLTTNTEKSVAA